MSLLILPLALSQLVFLVSASDPTVVANYTYPANGFATMTHYTMPLDFIASCGCAPDSTHYPTAALSELAFGSSRSYGPSCGRCFNLTLLNTFLSDPPFYPSTHPSVVVKVTDLCPAISVWCKSTPNTPNPGGHILNFDLVWPSIAIPNDFFPSNVSLYGYSDFGVWNISYESVPCTQDWAGGSNAAAMGSLPSLGQAGCCPGEPNATTICPSFSLTNGTAVHADTSSSDAQRVYSTSALSLVGLTIVLNLLYSVSSEML